MKRFLLKFDDKISKLESENRWKTAADIVWQQWKDNPNNIDYLLCAGTQLWYTHLVMDEIRDGMDFPDNIEIISCLELENKLMDITRYGFEFFGDNVVFNTYFGYMITVMPYYFIDYCGDYIGWEMKGIEMRKWAYMQEPNNPFLKAMYNEKNEYGKETSLYEECKKIWAEITPTQWGKSEVQQYFFRILNGDWYCEDVFLK